MNMQPAPDSFPNIKDSVVSGDLHTGTVVHNHYHAAPQAQPVQQVVVPQQPVYQQSPQVVVQPQYPNYYQQHGVQPMYYGGAGKDTLVAYVLWFFLGFFGAHRFYLNNIGLGFVYLLTFGLFGFGWLIDLFLIPDLVRQQNMRR
jgi:hypothetical protein